MAKLIRVTDAGLKSANTSVEITSKKLNDGSDNPNYLLACRRLPQIQAHYDRKIQIVEAARKAGYRVNSYEGTCSVTAERVPANLGFTRKNDEGKWATISFFAFASQSGIATDDLPEIEGGLK